MKLLGFDGPPLTLGKVRGFRSWTLDGARLRSVAHQLLWSEDLHFKECFAYPPKEIMPEGNWEAKNEFVNRWRRDHPMESCSCGFYAFYDAEGIYLRDQRTPYIHGIIEGWGETVIGSKGFRTTKAQIVALCVNNATPWSIRDDVLQLLMENYPSLPFFQTVGEMVQWFPLGEQTPTLMELRGGDT